MKVHSVIRLLLGVLFSGATAFCASEANTALDRARQMEDAGNSSGARTLLAQAVRGASTDAELLTAYAELLERSHDAGAREAFRHAAAEWKRQNKNSNAAAAQRRAVLLDLIAGDRAAAETDLAAYRDLGRNDLTLPAAGTAPGAT
jgi:hypothetical protein